ATKLKATASTAGSFVYSPRAGTLLRAGLNQALSVAFTPNDTANYESGAAIASIDVTRASLSVSADSFTREYGTANPLFTGSVAGVVPGDNITTKYSYGATMGRQVGTYANAPSARGTHVPRVKYRDNK